MTVYRQGSKARFTLRTAPYADARMWMYGAVHRRMLTQETADANHMLLIVVSGHNCVAVCCRTATQRNMLRARFEQYVAFVYV